jgi:hypothetical protein
MTHPVPLRRRALLLGALSLPVAPSAGCAKFRSQFTPGALDWDSKPLAFRYGAQSENLASGLATSASQRLRVTKDALVTYLDALDKSRQRVVLDVTVDDYDLGGATFDGTTLRHESMMVPGLSVVLRYEKRGSARGASTAEADGEKRGFRVEGTPEGLAPEVVEKGQQAVLGIPYELNGMNTLGALVRKDTFEALVVRKRLEMGQKADPRIPDRPPEKSLKDLELGLMLASEADAAINRWRASMVLLMTLVSAHGEASTSDALRKAFDETVSDMDTWLRDHPLWTSVGQIEQRLEQFGMMPKPMMLPTPQNMLLLLDEDGYIASAVKVANGIASGSIADTVQGVAGFAPKDSSARTAMEALAAGARGDLAACADSLGKLGGKDPGVAKVRDQITSMRR